MKSALAGILGGLVLLWTPPPDTGTAIIRGRVVAADGGAPLARAEVRLDGARSILQFADADGRYEFGMLPPGRYTVQAGRAGYVTVDHGQWITLADKQTRDGVDFALRHGGAIEIVAVDDAGDPVPGLLILAASAAPRLEPGGQYASTDENGRARLGDLAPGAYYLTATSHGSRMRPPTFYPGTTVAAEAKPVQVAAAETLNLHLPVTARPYVETMERVSVRPTPGRISGRVLAAEGSVPLRHANVTLRLVTNNADVSRLTQTDDEGRYEFVNVADGDYVLHAERRGYAARDSGDRARQLAARLLQIADGQTREHVDLALAKAASLTVRVVDEFGNPHAGVHVNLLQFRNPTTEHRLEDARLPGWLVLDEPALPIETDDRGELRFGDLAPDEYFLGASPIDEKVQLMPSADMPRDRLFSYALTYYPGTTLIRDAQPIVLGAGDDRTVELTLRPSRAAHVGGRVRNADGTPGHGEVLLRRDPARESADDRIPRMPLSEDGRFLFPTVWPGRYIFEAVDAQRGFGAVAVDVFNDDVPDLVINMTPPGALRGRVVLEGGLPSDGISPKGFTVSTYFHVDAMEHQSITRPADDWSFTLTGVIGPSLLTGFGEGGWVPSRVMLDGEDVTRVPLQNASDLELVMAVASTVEGTVVDDTGQRIIRCGVLLFSEGTSGGKRAVYTSQSDATSRFQLEGVPPGSYFIVALPEAINDELTAPESLDRLERHATRVTIPPSGGVTVKVALPLTERD